MSMLIYIPKSRDIGRAHDHTGFWYIYGRAYDDTLIGCFISTFIYTPKSGDIGHQHSVVYS